MRMKPIIFFFIILSITAICFFAAILFGFMDRNELHTTVTTQEPQITLNQTISEAVTIYASSPYHRYSEGDLSKYFISEIVDEILQIYEPVNDPSEEKPLIFEEQPIPKIGSIRVTQEAGEYYVKLQFGEVFYTYRLTVAPNRIVTKIADGGITFE